MSQETTENPQPSPNPKVRYWIIATVYAVVYPVWVANVLWTELQPNLIMLADPESLIVNGAVGFIFWVISLLALWIFYGWAKNETADSEDSSLRSKCDNE